MAKVFSKRALDDIFAMITAGGRWVGPRGVGPCGFGPRGVGPRGVGPRGVGPRGVGPRWVGIDGPAGAGKTTLARWLAANHPGVAVVSLDDFAAPGVATWERERFRAQVVSPLSAGRAARYQVRRYDLPDGGWVTLPPTPVVVVEGVSATAPDVGLPWALRVYVDAPYPLRAARIAARGGAAYRIWRESWLPSELAYFARDDPRGRADIVLTPAPSLRC